MSDKPGARQTRRDVLLLPIAAASMAIKPGRGLAQASAVSDLQSDERVDLYTTAARLDADGGTWLVPIHGRVWRPVRSHTRKAVIAAALRAGYSVAPDRQSQMRFDDRIDLLLADNKGGRRIVVEILGQRHALPASAADGHVTGTLRIAAGDIGPVPAPRAIDVDVVLTPRDPRKFTGSVLAVPPTGRSIISDIDDTVKVTNVLDTAAMLRATFVEPFQAVDGMARALRSWVADGAALHFVSSTPWHLSDPLADFLERAGFPKATLSLKKIRLKDSSIQNILADATVTKPPEIAALLAAFPRRTFVLLGDSGEKDPEIYADFMRRHPAQVERVLIRNITGARLDDERFRQVLDGLDRRRWQLFREAAELPATLG